MVVVVLILLYVKLRGEFVSNFISPDRDSIDDRCVVFMDRGIRYLYYNPPRRAKRRVLVCGGSRCCVRRMLRESYVVPCHDDCEILCFQVRGSEGSSPEFHVSGESIFVDTATAYSYVSNTDLPVHVIAFSLGAYGAFQVCSRLQTDVKSLIVVGTFYDCRSMSMRLKIPCVALGFSNVNYVCNVPVPIMVVHSIDDSDVCISEAERLVASRSSANLSSTLMRVRGRHKEYQLNGEQCVKIIKFLEETKG